MNSRVNWENTNPTVENSCLPLPKWRWTVQNRVQVFSISFKLEARQKKKKKEAWSLALFPHRNLLLGSSWTHRSQEECAMNRLRGSGKLFSGTVPQLKNIRHKALRSWTAVQDTYFSTKVLSFLNFWGSLRIWGNGFWLIFVFSVSQWFSGCIWKS